MKLLLKKTIDKFGANYVFLFVVIIIYICISIFNFEFGLKIFYNFTNLIIKILPILIGVYLLIFVFMGLIDNTRLEAYLSKGKYFYKLILSIIIGIISSGPVYFWYPLFKKLKNKGLSHGHLACLIYARAIKIPLIPMMIFYFGIKFTIIFNLVILVVSLIIGPTFDFIYNISNILNEKNNSQSNT